MLSVHKFSKDLVTHKFSKDPGAHLPAELEGELALFVVAGNALHSKTPSGGDEGGGAT